VVRQNLRRSLGCVHPGQELRIKQVSQYIPTLEVPRLEQSIGPTSATLVLTQVAGMSLGATAMEMSFTVAIPTGGAIGFGDADHVAAMNLKSKVNDPKINLYTKHIEVRKILEDRFLRRRESKTREGDASSGEVLQRDATSMPSVQGALSDWDATAHGRTPSRPQRRKPDMGDGTTIDSSSPDFMDRSGETQRLESENKRSA
jgi:hypothetical protein